MQNSKSDPLNAIDRIEPKTKSARIKAMHGLIEQKIKSGVHLSQIVEALNAAGLDINLVTLKSYLYRLRRKHPSPPRQSAPEIKSDQGAPPQVNYARGSAMTDIDSIINPDPVEQAQELARYERLAKSNRRKS